FNAGTALLFGAFLSLGTGLIAFPLALPAERRNPPKVSWREPVSGAGGFLKRRASEISLNVGHPRSAKTSGCACHYGLRRYSRCLPDRPPCHEPIAIVLHCGRYPRTCPPGCHPRASRSGSHS